MDGRRSVRVLLDLPIMVWCDGSEPLPAHTLVVNEQGALILIRRPVRPEMLVKVLSQDSGQQALCRVAWFGGEDLPGLYKVGIEIVGEAAGFWGERYRAALTASPPRRA